MADPMRVASRKPAAPDDLVLLPKMANRHGLITGATGTGKTVTLQTIAEQLSDQGISVFMADVKGDLAGMSQPGGGNTRVDERNTMLGVTNADFKAYPVVFWDIFGESGHPIRATASDMGPLLLGRLLRLNDVQTGVLTAVFRIADDSGLLLLDLNDLRAMLQHVGENAGEFTSSYGNISKASIGTIQRGLLELESEGAETFFGEPMLNVFDLIQNNSDGRGVINILASDKLITKPKVYANFLLWLLSELFEALPEVGDADKPKLVFVFDEAHLLFDDTPPALLEKIEQVVRLIRSKGVGVYFVTQNPIDLPDSVLAQLGNRVQHALRAFTPRDQKAIKAMAETFRPNPEFSIEAVITELGVGEALVSLLDEKGAPSVTQRAFIYPPKSHLGAIDPAERRAIIDQSVLFGAYDQAVDRESAYELLKRRAEELGAQQAREAEERAAAEEAEKEAARAEKEAARAERTRQSSRRRSAGRRDSAMDSFTKTAARTIGTQVGRQLVRGVLGSLFGGSSRRR